MKNKDLLAVLEYKNHRILDRKTNVSPEFIKGYKEAFEDMQKEGLLKGYRLSLEEQTYG